MTRCPTPTGNRPDDHGQERTAYVMRKLYPVRVRRVSRMEWVVIGKYLGKTIEVKGRTEGGALENWQRVATFWGNG